MLSPGNALFAIALSVSLTSTALGQTVPTASANDNRSPAGLLRSGVLNLHLETLPAVWYPEEDGKAHLIVSAFAEEGHKPQIPGPMVRVLEGTEIAASIRNLLDHTIYIHGLSTRTETNAASQTQTGPTPNKDAADALAIAAG